MQDIKQWCVALAVIGLVAGCTRAAAPAYIHVAGDLDDAVRTVVIEARKDPALAGFSPVISYEDGAYSLLFVSAHTTDGLARDVIRIRLIEEDDRVVLEPSGLQYDDLGRPTDLDLAWAIDPLMARLRAPDAGPSRAPSRLAASSPAGDQDR